MIDIREIQATEHELYRALWVHAITDHASFFRIAPEDDLTTGIPTKFAADSFTLGAFRGADLVGVVSVERDARAKLRHKALVFRMFVHPDTAGHGIGKALLQRVIATAASIAGLRYLYLTVLANNFRAIQLYTALTFQEFAREPGAVRIDEQYVDELQMACLLVTA